MVMQNGPEALSAQKYDTLEFMIEAELHLMDMVDGDKVSVVAKLRMYI